MGSLRTNHVPFPSMAIEYRGNSLGPTDDPLLMLERLSDHEFEQLCGALQEEARIRARREVTLAWDCVTCAAFWCGPSITCPACGRHGVPRAGMHAR